MYVYLLKRIILIIAQKLDIIRHLERGVGGNKQELMYKFNIESFTIYDIKLQKVDGICFLWRDKHLFKNTSAATVRKTGQKLV